MMDVTFSSSDASSVVLTALNYDSDIAEPADGGTVTLDAAGDGTLRMKGTGPGTTVLTFQDKIGDEVTTRTTSSAPMVGLAGTANSVTQGVYSDSSGFIFSLYFPSLTSVTVNYDTGGSTLPTSLLGPLNSGSVTIPAGGEGDPQVFVPFNVPDDGKIAPTRTRVAVVNLDVPRMTETRRVEMYVDNNDLPDITINTHQDGANVTVDPQGDRGLLATVALSVTCDGHPDSSIFSWSPSQDIIWLTHDIGTIGKDDLASLPGVYSYNYQDFYKWNGAPPADLYAQAIGGSPTVDGTSMSLRANVSKARRRQRKWCRRLRLRPSRLRI